MAVGDKSDATLSAEFDVAEQTIRVFRMNHRADIQAVVAGMVDALEHVWIARKESRIQVLKARYEEYQELIEGLYEHAERETETLRSVSPEAGPVPIDLDKFRSMDIQQRKILRDVSEELGQLPSRNPTDAGPVKNSLTDFDTIAVDANGNWHAVR